MHDHLLTLAVNIRDLHREVLGMLLLDPESWDRARVRNLLDEYDAARRRLRILVHEHSELLLPEAEHTEARLVLQASLLGEMPLDRLMAGEDGSQRIDFSEEELAPVVEEYLSRFSYLEYAQNKLNGAFLVVKAESLPETASHFVDEIVECFAFERYTAVYALARVALESAIRGVYLENGLANPDSLNARLVREKYLMSGRKLTLDDFSPSLDQMIRRLCTLRPYQSAVVETGLTGTEPLEALLHRIREGGNSILHGNRVATRATARTMMHDLFRGLHALHEIPPNAEAE